MGKEYRRIRKTVCFGNYLNRDTADFDFVLSGYAAEHRLLVAASGSAGAPFPDFFSGADRASGHTDYHLYSPGAADSTGFQLYVWGNRRVLYFHYRCNNRLSDYVPASSFPGSGCHAYHLWGREGSELHEEAEQRKGADHRVPDLFGSGNSKGFDELHRRNFQH